jgi:crotonobetainyl-CoA:carnitine CoA-transferase CaiB-like acyl-CoA transferase
MTLPLSGLRVLEFTHAIMGPACGLVLADLGAEVIRVEKTPDGDDTRRLKGFGTGYYPFFNRNKKSVLVDLKSADGREIVGRLIRSADALIENFAPGTMDRLGLGYEALAAAHPRLIYCALKGFLTGPYEERVALDEVVQMMSGLAYMTGPVGQPLRAGASVIDIMGATYGAMAVLLALRERDMTGRGQLVQSGLFENAAFVMGHHMAYAALSNGPIPPMPARVSAWSIYRVFTCAGGEQIFVGVTSDKHWRAFCAEFKLQDLGADARLVSNNDRIRERAWLLPRIEALFAGMSREAGLEGCARAGIPFAPVARPEDLFEDPHLNAGGYLDETTVAEGVRARLPRLPLTLGGATPGLRNDPPGIGADTRGVLAGLGYCDEAIAAYASAGVIGLAAADAGPRKGE